MSWLGFVAVHPRKWFGPRLYCPIIRAKEGPVETVKSEIHYSSLSLAKVILKRKNKNYGLISV